MSDYSIPEQQEPEPLPRPQECGDYLGVIICHGTTSKALYVWETTRPNKFIAWRWHNDDNTVRHTDNSADLENENDGWFSTVRTLRGYKLRQQEGEMVAGMIE